MSGDGEGVVVGPEVIPPDRHLARLEAAEAKICTSIFVSTKELNQYLLIYEKQNYNIIIVVTSSKDAEYLEYRMHNDFPPKTPRNDVPRS